MYVDVCGIGGCNHVAVIASKKKRDLHPLVYAHVGIKENSTRD
jgi:hypothetical protein